MLLNSNSYDSFIEFIESEDAIFHYTSKETLFEKILPQKKLKFGEFTGTNDPQEYRPKFIGAVGWGWDRSSSGTRDALDYLEDLLHKKSKFLSFCTNTIIDNKIKSSGLLKSRMWSQYGVNHTGACLVFSKKKLIESLLSSEAFHYSNIDYQDPTRKSNPILKVDQHDFLKKTPENIALNFLLENKHQFFFTKQEDYRDESEFRVLRLEMDIDTIENESAYLDISKSIEGIVLGDNCPEVYFPTVMQLTKETSIIPKRLIWHKYKYVLHDLENSKGLEAP